MLALFASVFAASPLGSFHCAGMCGAFVALACGAAEADRRRQVAMQAAYHGGRLATYAALGAAAGAAGHLLDLAGAMAGLRSAAAVLAAGTMVAFAAVAVLRARGVAVPLGRLPKPWVRVIQAGHRAAMDRPPVVRAALIGLLTMLLPCGWLYAFVVTAAGTGNSLTAAAVMAAFWAGTLPTMAVLGVGTRALLGPAGRHLPVVTALAVAGVGIYVLVGRAMLDPGRLASQAQAAARADGAPSPAAVRACCKTQD